MLDDGRADDGIRKDNGSSIPSGYGTDSSEDADDGKEPQ